ncbi:outer membrane protein assembly factor BamD [Winogradskyella undariae]|uniref:outer membrane protein assembly factor BamD n=1 Tax=Winogradskyella TaxID=286104 RepID=UPI00156A96BF|nr:MULTISPECIES: outer membrane protein assembly factor BamD [Winogradskyella]NRR92341.1 outer membrane protein assembly factor BamD [Winogradskyella undariae]QXP78370.1 outer membrane protein assembly factor BamD [Winogradskyella sp. HaHa_3_26]
MKRGIYILLISIFFVSCSDYQKALKSEDTAAKYDMATELYNAEKWSKSYKLLEQILQQYRGKPQAEKITFMHAMCSYQLGDHYISSFHFDKFADIYPKSEKAEQAAFLAAKGYYFNSPVYSKEQKETIEAIEKLQLFVNRYPNSQYLDEANTLVKELDFKLEKKAFEIAKQYNTIAEYKASIKSFNNFLLEFPGASLRSEAFYYRYDSAYNLAILSVNYLKEERIKDAISYYDALIKAYPNSDHSEISIEMKEELQQQLNTFTTKS